MSGHDRPVPGEDRGPDFLAQDRRGERDVAPRQTLSDRHHIRDDCVVLERAPGAAATRPAHHLVRDDEHPVPVTDRAHRLGVSGRSRHRPSRSSDDRLEDERRDPLRARRADACVELIRESCDQLLAC